jgi:hypothetical protein
MKIPILTLTLLLLVGCATQPVLPRVHGIPSKIEPTGKSTLARYDVSGVVDALVSQPGEVQNLELEESEKPKKETPRQLIEVLSGLLDSVFRNGQTSISAHPAKMELVVKGGGSVQKHVQGALEDLQKHPDATCAVRVQGIQFDPESLKSWNVLFCPFKLLPGGEGEGLYAIVSGPEFEDWSAAAAKAGLLKGGTGRKLTLKQLAPANCFPACQFSFVGYYEEKPGGELDPVMDSMAFGVFLTLRGIKIASTKATVVRFEAEITHVPGGMKVLTFKTSRAWVKLPNVTRKRISGTAKIPDGSYLVLITGPFYQGCPGESNSGWPVMFVIKPSVN